MKKLLYFTMFIVGIISAIAVIFLPIYKFDTEKVKQNNTELIAQIMEPSFLPAYRNNLTHSGLSKEAQEEYKNNYYIYNNLAYSIINNDGNRFYQYNDYEVLNAIYKEVTTKDGTLTHESSDEEVKVIEKVLIDLKGEEEFNNLKTKEIEKELKYYKERIYQRVKDSYEDITSIDQVEAFLAKSSIGHVCDEFFLLYLGSDQEMIDTTLEDVMEKGISFKHILKTFTNAIEIDKAVWNKYSAQDLSFLDKCKNVLADDEFYNPLPLLGLGIVILVIFITSLTMIFNGLKGIRGRKYPHTFIRSIIIGGICLGLLMLKQFIPHDYFLKYHYTEYSRLLSLFFYGSFDIAVIIALLANLLTIGISVIGRFCSWKKRKHED